MNIALLNVDSRLPNLALMKIAAWHKAQGDSVQWYDIFEDFGKVYMSKIFNFTPDFTQVIPNAKDIIRGGTGYDIHSRLPEEIDRMQPDYSIYPDYDPRASLGFLTRGCPNKCKWCVVPQKEGAITPYMDIDEITQNGKRSYATLMDNNILAAGDYCQEQLRKIIDKGYHVDFNQALDARLVTDELAGLLASVKWINSLIRMGCDTPKQIEECDKAMTMFREFGYKGQFLLYCMIHGDIHECVARLSHWKHHPLKSRIRVMAQPFRDPVLRNSPPNGNDISPDGQTGKSFTPPANSQISDSQKPASPVPTTSEPPQWQKDLAHWANQRQAWWSTDFENFQPRKNFKCKSYLS